MPIAIIRRTNFYGYPIS